MIMTVETPVYVKIHNINETGIDIEAHRQARFLLTHNAFVLYDILQFSEHNSVAVVRRNFNKGTKKEFESAIAELLYHGYLIQQPVVLSEDETELHGYHFFENTFQCQFDDGLINPFELN